MILLAAAFAAAAAPGPPARAGECKWLHGRYAVYNGSGVRRIWVIGTRRMLSIYDDDRHVPPEIDRHAADPSRNRGMDDALYGDFYVCARERSRPGAMQHVRLLKTRRLLFRGKPFPAR